ncbi:hypothetical protein SAY86_019865 [Trapa natans]|uniref:NAC domain-containing protein n=1 Tax=Trapa natans TaxID=22666 RepID=A0AAN7LLN1_TRANT|nr:hypothetical protein SAY86_019865 [Trapa natans]
MKAFQQKDDVQSFPGFRFHPTDEELLEFYLRRKVDMKPMGIDHLIQQIDIYKHDPWDLPKAETGRDINEYYFCKRGRKYRNSIRPNRVTGSGFWKATGIDKPVYTLQGGGRNGHGRCLVGLKKTLVYYRGCAGKGTKTDWMMHEFRLPGADQSSSDKCTPHSQEEAEVWTVCRIFKRNANHKRYSEDWKAFPTKPALATTDKRSSKVCISLEPNVISSNLHHGWISSAAVDQPVLHYHGMTNTSTTVDPKSHQQENEEDKVPIYTKDNQFSGFVNVMTPQAPLSAATSSSFFDFLDDQVEQFTYENWDELRSMVAFSLDDSSPM